MPWCYLVAFKNYESRANWYRNAAEIDILLRQRLHGTKTGKPTLLHFDAPTMIGYQVPPKEFESIYCLKDHEPEECDEFLGFWPGIVNVPISSVEVRQSSIGEHAGRGVYAVHDIPNGTCIAMEGGVKSFHVLPSTWSVIESMYHWANGNDDFVTLEELFDSLFTYIEGYGFESLMLVSLLENVTCFG